MPTSTTPASLHLAGIRRYLVKSCRGEALESALVEPWGIAGDRRWMLIDRHGVEVTARTSPRLLLVTPSIGAEGLRFESPDAPELYVAYPRGAGLVPVSIWKDPVDATPAGREANVWFSRIVGRDVRLVYLDDPTRRTVDSRYGHHTDRVSFADGYPLLLATESSLAALNDQLAASGTPEPMSMTRFRPSLIVAGSAAWDEDSWRRLRIGDALFRAVKGCARCVMTTVDPDTAARGKEPLTTLAHHRKWDRKVWFAINLIPDNANVTIHVGDEVEVLERADSPEPQR